MTKKVFALAVALVAALALAGIAGAHVTVHPNALPAGGFTTIGIRMPNERPKAASTKVQVFFPKGFYFLSYEAKPGWKTKVAYRKLTKPVKVFGETITQEVDTVTWTGRLPAGQFIEFPLSVAMPAAKAGTVLTFKALQTYSNGEIVRWIGPPSADEPAPQVMLRGANTAVQDYPGGIPAIKKASARSTHAFATPLQGIVVGIPLLGLAGLGVTRRRRKHS